MSTKLDLPLILSDLSPDDVTWLAAKSAQTGKSTADVARDVISNEARKSGFEHSKLLAASSPTPEPEAPQG